MSSLATLLTFLVFAVKLPIYGLHFWLPIAHVEAPTFGRIVLAGVLLKLGGVGLFRFSAFMDLSFLKVCLVSYLFVFIIFSSIQCLVQADFKRLVAYSSVVHMMPIPLLLLSRRFLSSSAFIMIMFYHGLRSPLLFAYAGILYSFFGTRQLAVVRGFFKLSPFLSLFLILAFFFSLPAPPFPSFLGEVFFFLSSFSLSCYFIPVVLIFAFIALLYNAH